MPLSKIDSGQITEHVTDPTVNDGYSAGYDFGSEWLNTTTGSLWKCIDPTDAAAVWHEEVSQFQLSTVKDNNAGGFNPVTMSNLALYNRITNIDNRATDSNPVFFNPSGSDYIECTASTYEVRANVIYRGTGVWTPNAFLLMVSRSTASGTGYFRLYDYTNAQIIFERSFTNVAKITHIFPLTPTEISLFSSGVATLEYQLRRDGNAKVYLHAAGLYSDGVI